MGIDEIKLKFKDMGIILTKKQLKDIEKQVRKSKETVKDLTILELRCSKPKSKQRSGQLPFKR